MIKQISQIIIPSFVLFSVACAAPPKIGQPITPPDLPLRAEGQGVLTEDPIIEFTGRGVFTITLKTSQPTPAPVVHLGLNTLDEELDYARYRTSTAANWGQAYEMGTEHTVTVDFRSLIAKLPNTPFEPRICWRAEIFMPTWKSTRFVEGRVYYNPQTLGDTVNILYGPHVEDINSDSVLVAFETDRDTSATLKVRELPTGTFQSIHSTHFGKKHEISADNLKPGLEYEYRIVAGDTEVRPYQFRTATMDSFEFAAMVDSREGIGGGMQNYGGVNGGSLYSLVSDAYFRGADFIIFAGDLISGYTNNTQYFRSQLQYFSRAVEPVHARIPVYEGMGNHEALIDTYNDGSSWGLSFDKDGAESAESVFADVFVNPTNGPDSEGDGSPTYNENVYSFNYGTARVFMINNNYWWSSNPHEYGGNLEGFFLPNQLQWLREQVAAADADPAIKHLFFAAQEPPFPNGGHTGDAMWYNGGDTNRDGVIDDSDIKVVENRNEMWEIISSSPKTVAYITGDEHAYCRMSVNMNTVVGHHRKADGSEAFFAHPVWQVTSGGAGAPWYDKELNMPWSASLLIHSTQPHYAFFRVQGDDVYLEAYSQTGQKLESIILKEDGVTLSDQTGTASAQNPNAWQ